ncbi:molybdopterin-dependent oxidoreductase [Candidatus Scalindua japonica]|nr:molybdopterin-dependent oxidoreductase [Candidatus Scalindua japonica]
MKKEREDNLLNSSVNRRTFIKVSGALASATVANQVFSKSRAKAECVNINQPFETGENCPDDLETADDIIYSVCQMCHSRCGIRAKVKEGVLVKIDGNPYHPNNRDVDENNNPDRLPYNTSTDNAVNHLGRVCLKGQAGIQTVYDPFRIQKPLRRVGPRNSGQWETISWEQAFSEIAGRINELIPPEERDDPIDQTIPELGKKRNQLAFSPGRSVEKEMSERIWKHGWGTINYGLSHTSVCESTRHVANELITWDPNGSKNSMGAGRTEGWQADILGAEYIIYFGSNALEAGFPMVGMARNLMQFKRNGGKYVVVDPRYNNTAAKADQWVPIKPGTDAALAMGIMRSIIDLQRYDILYLKNTNSDAAAEDGIPTWTDSTYLVGYFTDDNGKPFQRYINAKEAGISNGTTVLDNDYVVWSEGILRGFNDIKHGELDVEDTMSLDGVEVVVKSAFRLLKESAMSKGISEYESICGVQPGTISNLAMEFVSHGKKAVAMTYRGPIKHTNGLYNQLAIQHLNTLIGNYDFKGGCTAGAGGWSHKSGVVNLSKVAGDPGHEGIRIDRAKTFYNQSETGNLFTGYPAARPWFPFGTHGNYQEVIPSIQDQYPYAIKVLITYWNAMPYSVPALRKVWEETMADETKLPLLVSISPVMGEVAAWADYVLPDSTYLEKFSVPGIPWRVNKGTSFQRPVVGKFDGSPIGDSGGIGNTIPLGSDYTPVLPETKSVLDIQIGLAKELGLPGVGADALLNDNGDPVGNLNNSLDWAKALLQNMEFNTGVSTEEIISKGGVFDNPGDEYTGDKLTYQYGNIIRTFNDPIARTIDSVKGVYYSGVPQYLPITHSNGNAVSDPNYPYNLITYKTVHHGQARTNVNPWLMLMAPENFVEINAEDADALGIETGDMVNVSSASNPNGIEGKAKVTQGLMPGVVGISHHYGHWEQSSRSMVIDGEPTGHDPSRGAGIQPTQIMRTDNQYPNVSLQEPIGASCSFFNTSVTIIKV